MKQFRKTRHRCQSETIPRNGTKLSRMIYSNAQHHSAYCTEGGLLAGAALKHTSLLPFIDASLNDGSVQ